MIKKCIICGKAFEINRPKQVTCGKSCRRARNIENIRKYRQTHQKEKLICLSCGKEFEGDKGRKYCNRSCANRENNKNRKSVRNSLCWTCIHAVPSQEKGTGCNWSRSCGEVPVKGSAYEEKTVSPCNGNGHDTKVLRIMTKCPKYKGDTKVGRW